MTKRQAAGLLLTVKDMPTGWAQKDDDDSETSTGTVTPAKCSIMTRDGMKRTTLATISFSEGGLTGPQLLQEIYRPEGGTGPDRLNQIQQAMSQCSSYQLRDKDGVSKAKLGALSFPELGDATLAVRGQVETPLITATDDVVYVAVGDVIVRFDSVGITNSLSGEQLEKIVRAGVERLKSGAPA